MKIPLLCSYSLYDSPIISVEIEPDTLKQIEALEKIEKQLKEMSLIETSDIYINVKVIITSENGDTLTVDISSKLEYVDSMSADSILCSYQGNILIDVRK